MAQTGFTPIKIYSSSTAAAVPLAADLAAGELAINTNDGKLFYKDSSGVVQTIGTKNGVGSTSTTQVLYNNAGALAGSASLTFDGTILSTGQIRQSSNKVALGLNAGVTNQGSFATALGNLAGQTNQGGWGIAIGSEAGNTGQGLYSIAIGRLAAYSSQAADAISIGRSSGATQSTQAVAIGYQAGASGQGAAAVAIGPSAGGVSQGASSVAIGDQAGYGGSQGYSVSIGYKAGYTSLGSATNVIILNATGAEVSGVVNQSSSFYVAPIRTNSTAVANSLRYNTTTKEVTYTDTIGYAAGSGGTVTQLTSRTTGVTLNKLSGAITLFSAAGSSGTTTFTVTNSTVTAADTIIVNQKTGSNLYVIFVTAVAAGSFNISFFAISGVATEAPVFNFNVIRGSTS